MFPEKNIIHHTKIIVHIIVSTYYIISSTNCLHLVPYWMYIISLSIYIISIYIYIISILLGFLHLLGCYLHVPSKVLRGHVGPALGQFLGQLANVHRHPRRRRHVMARGWSGHLRQGVAGMPSDDYNDVRYLLNFVAIENVSCLPGTFWEIHGNTSNGKKWLCDSP